MIEKIDKSVLFNAKSFLCWDIDQHLAIQLVPLQKSVAYFYPKENQYHTIVVFYDDTLNDLWEPLYYLFHEAGHLCQYDYYSNSGKKEEFDADLNSKSQTKVDFERKAWEHGGRLLSDFIFKYSYQELIHLDDYFKFSEKCIASYADKEK